MQIKTRCPQCQKSLRCPEERVDSLVRCPACRHKFQVTSIAVGGDSLVGTASMEAMHTVEQPPEESAVSSERSKVKRSRDLAAEPTIGTFGHYELKETLGGGGFGIVYRAWDTKLSRQVALKVPRFEISEEKKLRRFRQEAKSAARLQHPNIVAVIEEGQEGDKPFIVSEYVDGEPLSSRIKREPPGFKLAAEWVRDLAQALSYAHEQGVVHRDIKPDNIMLGKHGRPQIMDFGLAKQLDDDSSLSVEGSVLGTPAYMSPEQARGETGSIDRRSDQYSLGVLLYELLTGRKPFEGPTHSVLTKVADRNQEPPSPRSVNAEIPRDLEAICQKAMSKEPEARYDDLSEMAADLDRWLIGRPTKVRPVSPQERAWRWCRRNPALAGAGAVTSVALLVTSVTVSLLLRRSAEHATAPVAPLVERIEVSTRSTTAVTAEVPPPPLAIAPFDAAQARRHQQEWADYLSVPVESVNSIGMKLTLIPPGEFLMGSTDEELDSVLNDLDEADAAQSQGTKDRVQSEQPQHRVVITQPFLMGTTEVTIGQFRRFVAARQYITEAEQFGFGEAGSKTLDDTVSDYHKQRNWWTPGYSVRDDSPVTQVTWNDAVAFCQWLSDQEGVTYRLPTEAEWEFACRAGTTTRCSFGDVAILDQYAWHRGNSEGQPRPVGTKQPNAFGLYDMHGNLLEWCFDWYGKDYYGNSPTNDPLGPATGGARVVRGGSWSVSTTGDYGSPYRNHTSPWSRRNYIGYRVVKAVDRNLLDAPSRFLSPTLRPRIVWQPTPEQQAFLDEVARLPVEEQATAVARKLQEINPGFDGQFTHKIEEGQVTEFKVSTVEISDIWPVRALLDLKSLRCPGTYENRGKLKDLSPLAGMSLTSLALAPSVVDDLSPLAGMPLKSLYCSDTSISDLSPLKGMSLKDFSFGATRVSDLTPLAGMPLDTLKFNRTRVSSLSPLLGMPLTSINCSGTLVADFEPLVGMPLTTWLVLSLSLFHSPDEQLVRGLSARRLGSGWNDRVPANEFWEAFAARRDVAETFAAATANLPVNEQILTIIAKLRETPGGATIGFGPIIHDDAIVEATITLPYDAEDITPLRALTKLRKLTVNGGPHWLDLSPINNQPLEELTCSEDQALRNAPMLATIETLKTINGQSARQYLDSLVKPRVAKASVAVPTAEELLAAHPPLDEWLEGREVLTVAQDGSAMFTTIQAALDAQKDGQVVRVLDKGPYRESLKWKNRQSCGLVTTVGTIVELRDWESIMDGTTSRRSSHFSGLLDCRLHGFTFLFESHGKDDHVVLAIGFAGGLCIEHCAMIPLNTPPVGCVPQLTMSLERKSDSPTCIRNNLWATRLLAVYCVRESSLVVTHNWFHCVTTDGTGSFPSGITLSKRTHQEAIQVAFENNVSSRNRVEPYEFGSQVGDFVHLAFRQNTTAGPRGPVLRVGGAGENLFPGQNWTISDNLSLVEYHSCEFTRKLVASLPEASRHWTIDRNYSNGAASPTSNRLPLGTSHPTEIRVLSTDPLDRNFLRVDPDSITVPPGDPFPGALPPGPAPEEGDWFTRLQDRWKEALELLPEEERRLWSQPIQLPKFQPAQVSGGASSGGAAATRETPANPNPPASNGTGSPANVTTPMPAAPGMATNTPAGTNPPLPIDRNKYPRELRELLKQADFTRLLDDAEADYQRYRRGFLVFGRVGSSHPNIDPRLIEARAPIAAGGYFVDLVSDAGTPIAFALHGHETATAVPVGPPDDFTGLYAENLGTIALNPLASHKTATLSGQILRLDLRGRTRAAAADLSLQMRPHVINHPSDGRRTRSPNAAPKPWERSVRIGANGTFRLTDLTSGPAEYVCTISLDGCIPITETIRLAPGSRGVRLERTLEQKVPLVLETIEWKEGKFDLKNVKTARLFGGDEWTFESPQPAPAGAKVGMGSMGSMGGNPFAGGRGGTIHQKDRKLTFSLVGSYRGGKALGTGELATYVNVDPKKALTIDDQELEIEDGRVYLLRSCGFLPTSYPQPSPAVLNQRILDASSYVLVKVRIP